MKTSMMIVIVLYHSCVFFSGKWFTVVEPIYNANYLYKIAKWFNTFHIQTFTMASGFLFYYLKKEKNRYTEPKVDIIKRAKRLLIPYLFTCILWVIPIGVYFFKYGIKDVLIKYVLMTAPSQLWYLIMLFGVFVFFEFFSDKIKINTVYLFFIYLLTTMIGNILSYLNINYFQISIVIKYILYFYLGGYIYTYKEKITQKQVIKLTLLSIIFCFLIFYINKLNIPYITSIIEPILSVSEISVIYWICTWLINQNKINTNNKLYKLLEENSFGIYLFHQQIIYFTIVLLNGVVHPIIQVLLSFVISLNISLLMSYMLKKNKYTKFVFGL